ncbi:MAG TPA: hypothetical protein ENK86_03045 [Campylobacterales bacterium]|nr:hypothetical protein [Campylobacterales bacterium]
MKLYYYAHTGHANSLDRLRKASALLNTLNAHGLDTMLLLNDFRAGLVAKELGIKDSVTIETVMDIDAIATFGDVVIIDSPEDDKGRMEQYCRDYKQVFRFAEEDNATSRYGEIVLPCDVCITDDIYTQASTKEERTLLFLGDNDRDKKILAQADFFDESMELLLGHYFYVKYEKDLANIFTTMHESDEYSELISNSKNVVTTSPQCALEARISGANVIFIDDGKQKNCTKKLLDEFQILTIDGFDKQKYQQAMLNNTKKSNIPTQKTEIIVSKILNNLSL